MRGPNPDEMQAPTGNTIAWVEVVGDEDRSWADAGADAMVAARMIAIPRIHVSPPSHGEERTGDSVRNAAALRCALD
jgi:hypothetical protein